MTQSTNSGDESKISRDAGVLPRPLVWKKSGMLVWRGVPMAVQVDAPLLVMDCLAWARTVRESWRANFGVCDSAEEIVDEMSVWIEEAQGRSDLFAHEMPRPPRTVAHPGVLPWAMRSRVAPLRVTAESLGDYLKKLIRYGAIQPVVDTRASKPVFLWMADGERPVFYGTRAVKAAVAHAGDYTGAIRAEMVTEEALADLFDTLAFGEDSPTQEEVSHLQEAMDRIAQALAERAQECAQECVEKSIIVKEHLALHQNR